MANPGADFSNVRADDVLAPRRQQEIAHVVEGLSRFRPTKVLVEHPYDDPSIDDAYRSFCDGIRTLSRSETQQLGFRLAHAAGHDRIYPVDVLDKFYEEEVERLFETAEHAQQWQSLLDAGEAAVRRIDSVLRGGTVADALRALNGPVERADALAPYLESLLPIAQAGNFAGPDMVANWYRRNFRIAANVHAIAEDGDRLVMIYGAGHIPVLEHAFAQSSRFTLKDPLDYLTSG